MDVSDHKVDGLHIAVTAHNAHGRPDTTMALRNRLGFHDELLWKRFCVRRLNIIHALNLNTRKASEQEAQVQTVAQRLCAEYGYPQSAIRDFEKLMRAGIQSVRRNQKRSPRNHNHQVRFVSPTNPSQAQQPMVQQSLVQTLLQPASTTPSAPTVPGRHFDRADTAAAALSSLAAMCPHTHPELLNLAGEGFVKLAVATAAATAAAAAGESATQVFDALTRGPLGESVAQLLHAPDAAGVYTILGQASLANPTASLQHFTTMLARLLNLPTVSFASTAPNSGPSINANTSNVSPGMSNASTTGIYSNGTNNTTSSIGGSIGSSIGGSIGGPMASAGSPHGAASTISSGTSNSISSADASEIASAHAQLGRFQSKDMPPQENAAVGMIPGSQDRRVLLRYQDRTLELTFSPLKSSPPTLAEIIEHGRQTFAIQPDTIVRLRDVTRGHIVDNNSDLIDAFCRPVVDLELFLPPPMLPRVQSYSGFGNSTGLPRPGSASDIKHQPNTPVQSHSPPMSLAQSQSQSQQQAQQQPQSQPQAQTQTLPQPQPQPNQNHGFAPLVPMMLPPLSSLPVLPVPQTSAFPPPQHLQLNGSSLSARPN